MGTTRQTTSSGNRPSWITPALLASTIRLWSRRYGRPVGDSEAIDLLNQVSRLLELLHTPSAALPRAEG
ncbi:MAG: hypothetical protein QM754_08040 [Tepidisphaeraceae bacterium]